MRDAEQIISLHTTIYILPEMVPTEMKMGFIASQEELMMCLM